MILIKLIVDLVYGAEGSLSLIYPMWGPLLLHPIILHAPLYMGIVS